MISQRRFFRALILLSPIVLTGVCGPVGPIPALAAGASFSFLDRAAVDYFYKDRKGEAFWTRSGGGLSHEGDDLLNALDNSWTHGLNPETYHVSAIHTLLKTEENADRPHLELMLADGYARYVHDLTGMRVSPHTLELESLHWQRPVSAKFAFKILARENDVEDALKGFVPQGGTYKKLRQELIDLSEESDPDYEKFLPIRMSGQIKPGTQNASIPVIRQRLGLGSRHDKPNFYDDSLAAAVIRFQKQSGLIADGFIGAKTFQLLNRTRRDEIRQLIANLERLRWISDQKPDRFIVVNIPSATLWALDHGHVALDMPVIVGKPERPTKTFIADITGVRFNPTWTVPPTIKSEDILPKIQEDPDFLTDKGMELVRGKGDERETIDPSAIDWKNLTPEEAAEIRMVQQAGDNNPLGKIRILMPNSFDMYLHDTNHRDYFNQPQRMISSGCMRMQDPEAVASFIMQDEPGWSPQSMKALLDSGKTRDVMIKHTMPVYILYYTTWVGDDGQVVFGDDAYGEDARLIKALSAIDGIPVAQQNSDVSEQAERKAFVTYRN